MPTLNESGVLKLPNKDRKPGGTRTQNPNRARRPYVKPSEEDAARLKVKRDEFQTRFDDAVLAAREQIWRIMEGLHDEVPEHTADWFYTYLMQQPKFTGTTRAISKWQAFVSIEFEKRNNGTSSLFSREVL